ncbi:MAG TPA: hypothetical protein PKA64_17015 [Myxococcota bacterium]|nr:hypothetical protein [Myxococcota bacterium]
MRTLPLALLAACYTQGAYVDVIGGDYCARARTCDPTGFESTYDDMKGCRADWEDVWGAFDTCLAQAGCTFDPKEAAACGAAVRKADCDAIDDGSWAESCAHIYTCDVGDAIETAFCSFGF